MRVLAAMVLALALALPSPAQAKSLAGMQDGALLYLDGKARQGAGPLAANVAEAVAANGLDANSWPAQATPIADQVVVPPEGASFISLLRPLRALALAGDPRAQDLAVRVRAGFDGTQFGSPGALNDDAYAILALRAFGAAADDAQLVASAAFLRSHADPDGGWGWSVEGSPGTDMTGVVFAALRAAGTVTYDEMEAAAGFVLAHRDGDGFAESADGKATCESTVWGLRTLGHAVEGTDAKAWRYLLSLQQPDGGFAHTAGGASDLLCTAEVAALVGEAAAGDLEFTIGGGGRRIPAPSALASAFLVATVVVAMSTRIRHP